MHLLRSVLLCFALVSFHCFVIWSLALWPLESLSPNAHVYTFHLDFKIQRTPDIDILSDGFFLLRCFAGVARFVNSKHVFSRVRALSLLICQCFCSATPLLLVNHLPPCMPVKWLFLVSLYIRESAADFMHSPRHA